MTAWVQRLEVEREQYYPPPTSAQLRGFFGKLRYSGVWIFRFLDFTTDVDGEAEILAEIERNGFIEARMFQVWHGPSRGGEEWHAIGDPAIREEDRREPHDWNDERHWTERASHWKKKEKAAKDFWKHAAGTYGEDKRRLGRCINCGEAATERWQSNIYCEDCVPEEAEDAEVDAVD